MTYKRHNLVDALVPERQSHQPVYVYENSDHRHAGREVLAVPYLAAHSVLDPLNLGFAAAFNVVVEQTAPYTDLLLLNPYARLRARLNRTREVLPGRESQLLRRLRGTTR